MKTIKVEIPDNMTQEDVKAQIDALAAQRVKGYKNAWKADTGATNEF